MPSSGVLKENLDKAGFSAFAEKTHIHLVLGDKKLQFGDILDEISINLIVCKKLYKDKNELLIKDQLSKILLGTFFKG